MSLEIRTTSTTRETVITLIGDVDAASAPRLEEVITDVTASTPRRLVVDLAGLDYLSSAGLRCLVFAHQRLGRGVEIVLAGAHGDVAETIHLSGFDRGVTMRGRASA
jgi:anti-anti-sigma factor